MDTPFTLEVAVDYINRPPELPAPESLALDVTLRHNVAHLKHSIWLFSGGEPKPLYLRFRSGSSPAADGTPLSEILGADDPANVPAGALRLTVDYSLYGNPGIPSRDAVPDLFDVDVVPQFETLQQRRCFTRESLCSTVLSIKELASLKFGLPMDRMELRYNDTVCDDESDLRCVLRLSVPPLHPVTLSLQKKERTYPVQLESVNKQYCFVTHVSEYATAKDLKEAIAEHANVDTASINLFIGAHSFCKASSPGNLTHLREVVNFKEVTTSSPVEVLFDANDAEAEEHTWNFTGKLYAEIIKDGEKCLVDANDVPPAIYDLTVGEHTFQYSSREMIVDPAGSVYMDPSAVLALSQVIDVEPTNQNVTSNGTRVLRAGPQSETSPSTATAGPSDTAGPSATARTDNPHGLGVFRNLNNIVAQNRAAIAQTIVQIGLAMALSAHEKFFLRPQLKLYVALIGFVSWIGVLWFGRYIGELIDNHLLADSERRSVDHRVFTALSLFLKASYDLHERATKAISRVYIKVMTILHPPKYEILREQIVEGGISNVIKRQVYQIVGCVLMGGASAFPFLEAELIEWTRDLDTREERAVAKSLQAKLGRVSAARAAAVQALIQRSFAMTVEDITESRAPFSDVLTCYLMVCWIEKHGLEKPLPLKIQQKLITS